ncbi:unnamed protein product [Lymnaea stagnalis]|uniref:Uncharacterized protein n=1 Tax=Lymnaea stagnalis TaxID=6523 RepID=A0AAV2IFD8_LYMST
MADDDRLANLLRSLCSCSICQGTLQVPRVLPCFHSFCTTCLEKYAAEKVSENGQRSFPCPKCSRQIIIPSGVVTLTEGFKADSFAAKLTEVIGAFREDKSCDICKRRDVTLPATDWCMDCFDAICESCLKVHLCGKTTSDHMVLSLGELRKLSIENVMKRNVANKCVEHGEDIKMYCLNCREPVCVDCFAATHRKCENCVLVSEGVKSLDKDVAEVMVRLQNLREEGSDTVPTFETGEEMLDESLKKTEAEIRSLANELRKKIDTAEISLLEELHSAGRHLRDKVSDSKASPASQEENMKALTSAQERLDALLKYGSDGEVLDVFHKVKDILANVEGASSTDSGIDNEPRLKVHFDTDESVKVFSREFDKFGEIRVEDCNCDNGLSSWGVTVTSREEIIVVDCRNRRVQKFSSAGDLMDHIILNEDPRDISSFGEEDVAITVMKKQIFIFAVINNLVLKRKIETVRQYDGIAYSSNIRCFVVSSIEERCIELVSRQGEVTKTFKFNPTTEESLFLVPRYVAVSRDNFYVVSDAANNSVVCVSQDGRLLCTYSSTEANELKKAQGVCCDKIGNLFVADYSNSRVHLLTPDGQFQRFVLGQDSGLRRPVALAITQSNKLVVVQSDGMVKIFSYETTSPTPSPTPKPVPKPMPKPSPRIPPLKNSHSHAQEESSVPHYGNFGTRRLSSYSGHGGVSFAKMFGSPGAIHSSGVGFHSARRFSEMPSSSISSEATNVLPQALKPRHQ